MTVKDLKEQLAGLQENLEVAVYVADLERPGDVVVRNFRGIESVKYTVCPEDAAYACITLTSELT